MALLLDTHVWLWLADGNRELASDARELINKASRDDEVYVSLISVWEIALLDERQRIRLSSPCAEWVQAALMSGIVVPAPLTAEILLGSTRLPGGIHRDPADRIIVATARALEATLVTRDRRLIAYGQDGHLDVLEA